MKETCVFLSYVSTDRSWAEKLSVVLASAGIAAANTPVDTTSLLPIADQLRDAVARSTHILVLIGPTTRRSKWVEREIEICTELREDGPGAGLIGIILPTHDDFSRPYYDPANVPIRLHDLAQTEYGIIRKWSEQPEEVRRWLNDAAQRRQARRPDPSLGAAAEIHRFTWDKEVDSSRPDPDVL